MELALEAVAEPVPGAEFRRHFARLWPHYRQWYLAEGHAARPTYLACERALQRHLPKVVPIWERMVELAGGGDLEARFLSLYCPPAYVTACSQSVWPNEQPLLVRNYDYHPALFEGLLWKTNWHQRQVIAMSDCLLGALDGVNDAGLAVSLNFGGSRATGEGFGAPLLVRYLLEFCATTTEAEAVLRQTPVHMAYNILLLDRQGDYLTGLTCPGQPTILRRVPASTNHQDRVAWPRHAEATATLARERRLFELLEQKDLTREEFVAAFLRSPLYQTGYARGCGTLYTAVYAPATGAVTLRWPGVTWEQSLAAFAPGRRTVALAT